MTTASKVLFYAGGLFAFSVTLPETSDQLYDIDVYNAVKLALDSIDSSNNIQPIDRAHSVDIVEYDHYTNIWVGTRITSSRAARTMPNYWTHIYNTINTNIPTNTGIRVYTCLNPQDLSNNSWAMTVRLTFGLLRRLQLKLISFPS